MEKLIVCIMGQNCEKFIPMCLESVKEADAIVYCDGGSTDNSLKIVMGYNSLGRRMDLITHTYNQEDKQMNGNQRNFYLKYLKENYPNDWALCLDCDEIVENIDNIKQFIQSANPGLYSVKMRHFIGNLGYEDATVQTHFALNRLFKISEADSYPLTEHPVLIPKPNKDGVQQNSHGATECSTIWHLGYVSGIFDIKNKYENHLKKSEMHTPEYLDEWKDAHILGKYPVKPVNVLDIPKIILDYYHVNTDKYYFTQRGIELKHPLQVQQWHDYFKPESVLELGAGRGAYMVFWKWFVKDVQGIEISQYAVNNAFCNDIKLGDITKDFVEKGADLVTCLDVLEHLNYEDLDKVLSAYRLLGNKFLFSIPFKGDPNLEADKTHIIKETKEWWINKLSQYFKIKGAPKEWLFNNQILIGEKNG